MPNVIANIPIVPAFRFGRTYNSLSQVDIPNTHGEEIVAKVGYVNPGLIRRDLRNIDKCFEKLQQVPIKKMLTIFENAAKLFMEAELPVSEGLTQGPHEYIRVLSATGGLPHTLIHNNMQRISNVLIQMPLILKGLTRNLDFSAIEHGIAKQNGFLISYYPDTSNLGIILPSNSPGVNSLWLPAVALRIPVILKPGHDDPWTPWRLINALLAAGCPCDAFGFYPTGHDGANVILSECQRIILFGDSRTVQKHKDNPRINVHGPGFSKILIGDDKIEKWHDYVDMIVESIAYNGGRSCINTSTVVVSRYGEKIATALAEKLLNLKPQPLDASGAILAGFSNATIAAAINKQIENDLTQPGAIDISASVRKESRLIKLSGIFYLNPTVLYCKNPEHVLSRREFLFPFVSVVELPEDKMLEWIGPSLVVTAITDKESFRRCLLQSSDIQRLNLGAIPTTQVSWDQPHEGNLFEFLYYRRAIQDKAE